MATFADGTLLAVSGTVARLSKTSGLMIEATGNGATEGTNLLTYAVPAGASGLYRVSAYIKTVTASDAATSHLIKVQVSVNDGDTAMTDVDLQANGDTTGDTIAGQTDATKGTWSGVFYAAAGTNLVVYTDEAVTGAKTAGVGAYLVMFRIERLD